MLTVHFAIACLIVVFMTTLKLDKGNNVGRNCFRVQQVQRVFSDAHKALLDAITVLESRGFRDCETFSLLTLLVGDLASLHQ